MMTDDDEDHGASIQQHENEDDVRVEQIPTNHIKPTYSLVFVWNCKCNPLIGNANSSL